MYSATFAMTIIIVIAATNLFLGFAAAVLLGRGPKRWSDIDKAIVLQPVSLRGLQPAPKTTVERVDLQLIAPTISPKTEPAQTPAPAAPAEQDTSTERNILLQDVPVTAAEQAHNMPATAPVPASQPNDPVEPAPQKIVLAPKGPVIKNDNDPPEKTLNQQLDTWRHSDLSDETPSMSGMWLDVKGAEIDDEVHKRLTEAVNQRIKKQVRKDRRVLNLGTGQFAWFSDDVPPEDALMPVERIRQMLTETQFQHAGNLINTTVVAGVVAGMPDDDAECLFKRLRTALQYAMEKPECTTCLDTGAGPTGVASYPIEVEPTECEL